MCTQCISPTSHVPPSSLTVVGNLHDIVFHACTKNIEVHYHFVRTRVLSSEVELRYVRTNRHVRSIKNQLDRYIELQTQRWIYEKQTSITYESRSQ